MLKRTMSVLMLVGLGLGLYACGNKTGERVENRKPFVRLTGGPIQGDSVSYATDFFWRGWDDDGVIDRYQYAIDIPADFTLDEINNPLTPGIAWTDTAAFRARFLFKTPFQDTIISAGGVILPERYRGDHTFYIRSVDNEGKHSDVDFLSFTARTVTPKTQFTIPQVTSEVPVLDVGRQVNVAWSGVDPDSPDPRRRPAYYEWKLIPTSVLILPALDLSYAVLTTPGPNFPWHRVGADTTSLSLSLTTPQGYILAVRAIDEACGVENKFIRGQNCVVMSALSSNNGTPLLTVSERALGSHTFPSDGPVAEFEIPARRNIRFNFGADVSAYGGVLQGYNYGIDVEDVDNDGPTSNFKGWTLIPFTFDPIIFNNPGIHVMTVKCRDTGGGVTIGTIILRVIAFPLDKELLYVDDYRLSRLGSVSDAMMDARVDDMLRSVGIEEYDKIDTWGPEDLGLNPGVIKLSDVSRYRTILWSNFGSGLGGSNTTVEAAVCGSSRIVQSYASAGGSIWFYGDQLFGSFRQFGQGCRVSLGYDETNGLNFDAQHFPCQFLQICGGDFREAKRNPSQNGLLRVRPTAKVAAENFPTAEVDSTVHFLPGIPYVDAMFQPIFAGAGLDTVYTMQAPASNSSFNNKPVAFRYRDLNPTPIQGPVAMFGFSFHLLKQGSATQNPDGTYVGTGVRGIAASMMNWFRKYQSAAQAHLSPQ